MDAVYPTASTRTSGEGVRYVRILTTSVRVRTVVALTTLKTGRVNSAPESLGSNRRGNTRQRQSLSTDLASKRRRTAPVSTEQNQRPNSGIVGGGPSRNRTGVQGFAVLCVTTPPSGRERSLSPAFPRWSTPQLARKRLGWIAKGLHYLCGGQAYLPQCAQFRRAGARLAWRGGNRPIRRALHRKCIRQI
jgi:hypothetical protein